MENFVKVIIESKLNVNLFVCLEIKPLFFKDFRKINNKKIKKKKRSTMVCNAQRSVIDESKN